MRVYLASTYGSMMQMREIRDRLVEAGHEVTSQWIDGFEGMAKPGVESTDEEIKINGAVMDVDDVRRSDVLVAFSHARGTLHTGGGRHVEFGIALERGIPVILFGPRGEHVFHYYPGLVRGQVVNVEQLVGLLMEMRP